MKQKLEMSLYQMMPSQVSSRQQVYSVCDLESLSASALYAKINRDQYIKANDEELNFYNRIEPKELGSTILGIQKPGESHKDFAKRMESGAGVQIVPPAINSSNS